MRTNGNDTEPFKPDALVQAGSRGLPTDPLPFGALAPISREILATAHRLPDAELVRIAGCLRMMADQVMAVVDRRCGARPAPRLVIDNTRR